MRNDDDSRPLTDGGVWIHVDGSVPAAAASLRAEIDDPLVVDALLAEETRPRYAPFAGGDILILRAVNLNPGAAPEDMVSLRIWVTADRIVTAGRRPLRTIGDLQRASATAGLAAADVLLRIVEGITARLRDAVRQLETDLEACETRILDAAVGDAAEVLRGLRRKAISLRRYVAPQLEALEDLIDAEPDWLDESRRARLRESADATERVLEALSATREHIGAVHDQVTTLLVEKTGHASRLLTAVATIFLPLNLAAALFGANVGGIPFATAPYGFWAITAGAAAFFLIAFGVLLRSLWAWGRRP